MTSKRKIISVALIVAAVGVVSFLLGPGFYNDYKNWQFTKQMDLVAEQLDKASKDEYQAMMSDTYGGKTPQETLKMYISAVEKGDYELASKYFVVEKQDAEAKSFEGTTQENLNNYIKILNSLKSVGYGQENKYYSMKADLEGPDFYTDFFIYPNGIWKILQM